MALAQAMSLLQGIIIISGIRRTGTDHGSIQSSILLLEKAYADALKEGQQHSLAPLLIKAKWSNLCCLFLAGTDRGIASAICLQLANASTKKFKLRQD